MVWKEVDDGVWMLVPKTEAPPAPPARPEAPEAYAVRSEPPAACAAHMHLSPRRPPPADVTMMSPRPLDSSPEPLFPDVPPTSRAAGWASPSRKLRCVPARLAAAAARRARERYDPAAVRSRILRQQSRDHQARRSSSSARTAAHLHASATDLLESRAKAAFPDLWMLAQVAVWKQLRKQ